MSGMACEVSGTFLAMRNRNTVCARSVAMDMVHFCPPAGPDMTSHQCGTSQHQSVWLSCRYVTVYGAITLACDPATQQDIGEAKTMKAVTPLAGRK